MPFRYLLPDSFWYFGQWYEPGDNLWFSSDGWVSFDPAAAQDFPTPPVDDPPFPVTDDPNAIIAPLWQDNDPTQTPEPNDRNRKWYYYDVDSKKLVFQWYDIQGHATGNVYDYEVILHMGGQELLEVDDCGVLYSGHLIHFLYNTSSAGWTAENGATGFEDQIYQYSPRLKDTTYISQYRAIPALSWRCSTYPVAICGRWLTSHTPQAPTPSTGTVVMLKDMMSLKVSTFFAWRQVVGAT
jgi:hypothetical protein